MRATSIATFLPLSYSISASARSMPEYAGGSPHAAVAQEDPNRAAEILVSIVKRDHLPTHIVPGVGAIKLAQEYSNRQIVEIEAWRQVSSSADYASCIRSSFRSTGLYDDSNLADASITLW